MQGKRPKRTSISRNNRHGGANYANCVLFVVEGIALRVDLIEFGFKQLRMYNCVVRKRFQFAAADQGIALRFVDMGQQNFATTCAMGRHAAARRQMHAQRPGAFKPVEIHELKTVQNPEIAGFFNICNDFRQHGTQRCAMIIRVDRRHCQT